MSVAFHANGSDPGSIDLGSLLYGWNFHDPARPVGAVGADVSHTFAGPGSYAVDVTVRDKDNAAVTDTVGVTILKRGTTAGYSGQVQATPSKIVSLSGSVTDQLGQSVPGRTVTFTLGSQSATAVTNSAGVATASLKLTQKQGTYPVSLAFAGDGLYLSSNSSTTFTIGK